MRKYIHLFWRINKLLKIGKMRCLSYVEKELHLLDIDLHILLLPFINDLNFISVFYLFLYLGAGGMNGWLFVNCLWAAGEILNGFWWFFAKISLILIFYETINKMLINKQTDIWNSLRIQANDNMWNKDQNNLLKDLQIMNLNLNISINKLT